jgi:hypothetical protein
MNMRRKTIFISCGQYVPEERELGKRVCKLVDESTPFEGYFAENQTTLKALSENVLNRLYESVGLIVIMHHRGKVEGRGIVRASVWIEQEVAIAALMEQVLQRPLHVAVFIQRGIAVEGVRQQLQLNSTDFTDNNEVIARLREILPAWSEPLYIGDDERHKLVESVDLSIGIQTGTHFNFTIVVENHSNLGVEVKSIVLLCKGSRVCTPVLPPEGVRWSVPARARIPIQFTPKEDVTMRLTHMHSQTQIIFEGAQTFFNGEIVTELRCDILGVERTFKETSIVQVDYKNRQIIGL